jgi:ATP-dependent DNA helicase RecQ
VVWVNCGACDVCLPHIEWKELSRRTPEHEKRKTIRSTTPSAGIDSSLLAALKHWRLERSRSDKVPAFVILHDSTLEHLCGSRPKTLAALRQTPGIGDQKLQRYGEEILEVLRAS